MIALRTSSLLSALWIAAAMTSMAQAQSHPVAAVYDATVAGVSIGGANITGSVDRSGNFRVEIDAKYKVLMWSGKIKSKSVGRLDSSGSATATYIMSTDDKDVRTASLTLERGTVTTEKVVPPLKTSGRIPMTDAHRRDVFDPLSGLVAGALTAASAPDGPCAGKLPLFTGWSRFDLAFTPAPGPAGSALAQTRVRTCRVMFEPIAGHKPSNRTLASLAASRDMRIEFSKPEASGLMLPDRITVPLWVGTLVITRKS